MGAYSIQPISDDETAVLPEENPILAFGPLGKINIFVGATNAGKSRFLRMLAKCESYGFYSTSALHTAASELVSSLHFLSNSSESLDFAIQQHQIRMSDRSPVVMQNLPEWAKNCLNGVQGEQDYKLVLNANFFTEHASAFDKFLSSRVGGPAMNFEVASGDSLRWQIATWARCLFQGEVDARKRDEEKSPVSRMNFTHQFESFTARRNEYISFDVDSLSSSWRDQFLRLWNAFDILNQTDVVSLVKPPKRFYIPTLRSAVSLRDQNGV